MTLDSKTIEELKNQLLSEKAELEKNLSRIARSVDGKGDYETTFDEIGYDREDNATEVDEYSDTLPVEVTLEKKLQEVKDALARIEKGIYGKCLNCDKEISLERLQANPAAKTCIECK